MRLSANCALGLHDEPQTVVCDCNHPSLPFMSARNPCLIWDCNYASSTMSKGKNSMGFGMANVGCEMGKVVCGMGSVVGGISSVWWYW